MHDRDTTTNGGATQTRQPVLLPGGALLKEHFPPLSAAGARRLRVKKIPPHMRRRTPNYALEPVWHRRILWRLRTDSQFLRSMVQAIFALLCIWIGIEFFQFVRWGLAPLDAAPVSRPPGVDGFLPISALISLGYWLRTGFINQIHPAGLAIFLAIVLVSLLFKKAFCSWLCPVGTLSEALWLAGRKLFGRNFSLPRWTDLPLRSVKYLLLAFFLWSIANMDVSSLADFIGSPYNKMADVKMYLFFVHISSFAFWTIAVLLLFSLFIKNFWCRYLCPYGALLGLVSLLSPWKIRRSKQSCVDCELCTRACPASVPVHTLSRVRSDECTGCLACVEACPVKTTLEVKGSSNARALPGWLFGTLVVAVFIAVTGLAIVTGHWQNSITPGEYRHRFQTLDSPLYQHFNGRVPAYGPND